MVALSYGGGVDPASPVAAAVHTPHHSARALDATTLESGRSVAVSRGSERNALQQAAVSNAVRQARGAKAAQAARAARAAKAARMRAHAWHLPTRGYHLTARFGATGGYWGGFHTGLDFAAPSGTPIFAVATGRITATGWAGSYGNRTVETLPDGTELWYAHQSAIEVRVGQQVVGGQTIGAVGSTGNTTGPHVHLEVRPHGGHPVDPYPVLVAHGLHP